MMLGSLSQLATNGCLSASLAVGRFLGSFSKQIRIKSLNSLDLRAPVPSVSQAYVSEGEAHRVLHGELLSHIPLGGVFEHWRVASRDLEERTHRIDVRQGRNGLGELDACDADGPDIDLGIIALHAVLTINDW